VIAWLAFAAAAGGVLALAGRLAERSVLQLGWPARWVWAVSMAATLAIPLGLTLPRTRAAAGDPVADPSGPLATGALLERATTMAGVGLLDLLLAAAWLAGSVAVLASLVRAGSVLRRRRVAWRPERLDGCDVLLSRATGPAVAGVLDPRIVLPEWAVALPQEDRRLLLAHEVEHVRARDPLLLLLGALTVAATPLNPALWWQFRRLRAAVELDCDARVIRCAPARARRYALLLVDSRRRAATLAGAMGFAAPSALERRVLRLAGLGPADGRPLLAAALLGALLVPPALAFVPAPPVPRPHLALSSGFRDLPGPWSREGVEPVGFDTAPALLNRHETPGILRRAHPPALRAAGTGGTVVVAARVDRSGAVQEARVQEGSGHTELDGAALRAVAELRFAPARAGGAAVDAWVQQPITFLSVAAAPAADPDLAPVRLALWSGGL
jgi:TonB family protein